LAGRTAVALGTLFMKYFLLVALPLVLLACFSLDEPAVSGGGSNDGRTSAPEPAPQEPERFGEAPAFPPSLQEPTDALWREAEERFAEKSFARAHELYVRWLAGESAESERPWGEFRREDTRWRSAASSENPDSSELDRAAHELRRMLERYERPETRDELYAELCESLGDAAWRERTQDWSGAGSRYGAALEWWARSSDLERARARYLAIVFRAGLPEWRERYWGHGYFPTVLPLERYADAVKIAQSDDDRARAQFLFARAWMNQGQDRRAAEGIVKALEEVVALGQRSEWYDDALFSLGDYHERYGSFVREGEALVRRADYAKALVAYRRLVEEFKKGESRYVDDCRQRIRNITAPELEVFVDRFFLPGSEVQFRLAWRNLESVALELVPVDLLKDVTLGENEDWLQRLPLTQKPVQTLEYPTEDAGRHEPGSVERLLAEKPAAGAYVLRARAGKLEKRALVLVTDVSVTVKASPGKLLAWATDARTGRPIEGADVRFLDHGHDDLVVSIDRWRVREARAKTGADGVALFERDKTTRGRGYFVALSAGGKPSYAMGWLPGHASEESTWRLYAYADRAAYRPLDTVQWKFWARTRGAGAYGTPANETVTWVLHDPQGTAVQEGTSTLNAFGAAWGSFATTGTMTLGEYQLLFYRDAAKQQHLGGTTLFRLEEYKLPEFEVTVQTPRDEQGRAKLFRMGDRVEVELEAQYLYGAPVAGAAVEVYVHQKPRYRPMVKRREFPWLYDDSGPGRWWGGQGQQILHETRSTDALGRVTVAFDTPAIQQGDFEFEVTARVTDASRREITGQGSVVVGQLGYTVEFDVPHALHRPGARVEVALMATDPNGNPVEDSGRVVVARERWVEVWSDPTGKRVLGDELERARGEPAFPRPGWQRVSSGYESEEVARFELVTGKDGRASFAFTPPKEGYHRLRWSSLDERDDPIQADATLFVADESTRSLGYAAGGIEILVDKDTLAVGEEAQILLLAPQSGRHVLFTVEGEELYSHQVLALDGQVKLVKVPITEAHVPNLMLGAVSIWAEQAWSDQEELVVPPVKSFLDVTVTSDAEVYEPGAEGAIQVLVKGHDGKPVATHLSLALVDEAVAYIQQDYAGDARAFFHGERRAQRVQLGGSFQHGSFVELERAGEGGVRDRRFAKDEDDGPRRLAEAAESGSDGWFLGQGARSELKQSLGRQYRGPGDSVPASPMADAVTRENEGGGAEESPVVRVRSNFSATALWLPEVVTDAAGQARVPVTFPDSTTRWRATARGIDAGSRVGAGRTTVRTRLPLIARLQTPRFLVEGDTVTLSANLDNNTDAPLEVQPALEVGGLKLLGDARPARVSVPANGSVRVDWQAVAEREGLVTLKLTAVAGKLSDGMERTLPVVAHGIEAFVALSGRLDEGALALALELPSERRRDSTEVTITLAPSLAVTMLDALPYLVDYPYGCVEQTLSRFLPAVVVAKTLREHGLSVEDALTRVFGGIELDSAAKTHPQGKEAVKKLDELTQAGLARLYDFQHGDGGWSWWKQGDSDPFMTAYVLWGLTLARDAGLDVKADVPARAASWLAAELVEAESDPALAAWMLHALAEYGGAGSDADARRFQATAFAKLWEARERLNAYGRALLALAAHGMKKDAEARILVENLANGVILDKTPDRSVLDVGTHQPYTLATAHWGNDGVFWRWSEGGVEATAFALRALMRIQPQHELVAPVMNWLVKNRRGAQWSNTRDTAISVLALDEYLRASGELGEAVEYELEVNGTKLARKRLEKEELLSAPGRFAVPRELLRDGANEIRVTKHAGAGPLYFAAHASFFSLEEPIPARGNELFVRRDCYRLAERETLLAGLVLERVPLQDGDEVKSGERVEVVLTLEAKNHLEYVVVEDLKAAGLEAVGVRSGEPVSAHELKQSEGEARFAADDERRRSGTARDLALEARVGSGYTGRSRSAHAELRDQKVAFFLERLPQGLWELRHELRAEAPGRFHALPTQAHAMYAPEIRGNGKELRLTVHER